MTTRIHVALPAERQIVEEHRPAPCRRCGGTGWLSWGEVDTDRPKFGKFYACTCLERELAQEARNKRMAESELPLLLRTCSFDGFIRTGRQQAWSTLHDWATQPKGWVYLHGGTGTGKTHLAAACANVLLAHDTPCLFLVVSDFLDRLRLTMRSDAADVGYFLRVQEFEVLILDDLGAEYLTDWAGAKLFQLLNSRHNACLPTLMTSNLSPEALAVRGAVRGVGEQMGRLQARFRNTAYHRVVFTGEVR